VRPAGRLLIAMAGAGLALAGCGKDAAPVRPGNSLRASLSADSAGLGDAVLLKISTVLPATARAVLPGEGDSLGGWKVLRRGPVETKRDGDWARTEREITIAAYRLGPVGPDTLVAWGVGAAGDSVRLAYAPSQLQITGKIKAGQPVDPASARDIRDVVSTGPPRWPWFVGGAVIMIAGLFALVRFLRARRRRSEGEFVPSGPTPEEEFERAIARLLASGMLEQGLYREFYYGVSSAVRLYLERVHGLPLLESTSSEVLTLLGPTIPDGPERDALSDWLGEGDLVKYARMERLQAEARNYLDRSLRLVRLLAARSADGALGIPPVPAGEPSAPAAREAADSSPQGAPGARQNESLPGRSG
jgi:hypothetical protein